MHTHEPMHTAANDASPGQGGRLSGTNGPCPTTTAPPPPPHPLGQPAALTTRVSGGANFMRGRRQPLEDGQPCPRPALATDTPSTQMGQPQVQTDAHTRQMDQPADGMAMATRVGWRRRDGIDAVAFGPPLGDRPSGTTDPCPVTAESTGAMPTTS